MGKGRYGRYVRWAITAVDFVILNLVFFAVSEFNAVPAEYYNLKSWGIVNISYLLSVIVFSDIHDIRIVYADKLVLNVVKMLTVMISSFFTLLWIADIFDMPWDTIISFFVIFTLSLSIWWILSRKAVKLYRAHGFNFKRVIIIGKGTIGEKLLSEMLSDAGYGYRVLGFFDDKKPEYVTPDYKGTIDDVESFVKDNLVDEMYCTLSGESNDLMERLMNIAESNAVDFYYVPQIGSRVIRRFELNNIGSIPALSVRANPLSHTFNKLVKRFCDFVCASIFLIFSPIIFIPVAIAIKLTSPGPVFFKQKRTGYRGGDFMCYKFRTMKVNRDSDKLQATANDPRKTKLGDFLRKTSIDELPQFINVWKGEMSMVGPRPHMIKHTQDYSALIDKYMLRHVIKPGITGWAQVNGFRGETKELWQMQKRVEYDVWYAENWNLLLDVKIILKTIINAIKGEENAF